MNKANGLTEHEKFLQSLSGATQITLTNPNDWKYFIWDDLEKCYKFTMIGSLSKYGKWDV